MPVLIYGLCFGAATLASAAVYPPLVERILAYLRRRTTETTTSLEDMFVVASSRAVWRWYVLSPVVLGTVAWVFTGSWIIGALGAVVGVPVPRFLLLQARRARWQKFHAQLVDGLLMLSSSMKAGMSMTQAFSVLAEEMPPPISQEFALVLKELRMGVGLDEAMAHLKARMASDDLNLFVTAVLVARETGGDVTRVFGRLVETVRERRKLRERIKTLTFMARMQGVIMAMLPFLFGFVVHQMNPGYFQFFVTDPTGQVMLLVIVTLWIVGAVLFLRFSRSPL